jgi:hypothetical protein
MSKSFRKSLALCLFVGCLTSSAFGAARDGREGGGIFAAIKRLVVHILDAGDLSWPRP